MDEFNVIDTKKKNLNKTIQQFRKENPEYEIYNISTQRFDSLGFGGVRFWVIWRLKNLTIKSEE